MELLNMLSEYEYVSGEKLAAALGVSRAAVHKQIARLRRAGYAVTAEKNRGYLLQRRPDRLTPAEIRRFLHAEHPWAAHIHCLASVDSTQAVAKQRATGGDPEGTLVLAEEQTAGYGRLQRRWVSSPGGLWLSLILRPALRPDAVAQLTLVCSLAMARAIERVCRVSLRIKWPNDLLAPGTDSRPRKIAGMLTEMSAEIDRVAWVVIGVGVNVNNAVRGVEGGQAVSLATLTGDTVDRARLLSAFLLDFEEDYRRFCRAGFAPFAAAYNERAMLGGKQVDIDIGGRVLRGRVDAIDGDGFLQLRQPDGSVERVIAGTVDRIYE